ncbi:uncharacterized protein LOC125650719 [Ostrea edulis]|uniref:uncharacterized protein LOC125650719 n=1 Tax=Ostrea edulis TaxID=37623 RepID=UPI0020963749|nr:uncharacterized protein LOC125650719 [Ostrea edulis]
MVDISITSVIRPKLSHHMGSIMITPEAHSQCHDNDCDSVSEKTTPCELADEELKEIEKCIVHEFSFEENISECRRIKYDEEDKGGEAREKRRIWRINTCERIQFEETNNTSEVFILRRTDEQDIGSRKPLGGFISSIKRKDGSHLHRFETVDPSGLLFKSFLIRDCDILVSLNSNDVSRLPPVSHEEVVEIFQNILMDESSTMTICRTRGEKYTFFKLLFCLREILEAWEEDPDDIKKANIQDLSGMDNKLLVSLKISNIYSFLFNNDGHLGIGKIENVYTDCKGHFIVRQSVNVNAVDFNFTNVYSFQSETDRSKFLGLTPDGKTIDLVPGKPDDEHVLFRNYQNRSEAFLRPCKDPSMAVFFNEGVLKLCSFQNPTTRSRELEGKGLRKNCVSQGHAKF